MAHSGVVTMLLLGIATPACTRAHVVGSAAKSGTNATELSIHLHEEREQDRSSDVTESGLVDNSAASDHGTNALYWADEPMWSTMTPVSTEAVEKMCNDQLVTCFRRFMNNPKPPWPAQTKGDRSHHEHCNKKCNHAHRACLQKAGLLQTFSALDAALSWVKNHGKEIVGTIIIIGGVAYVVSTGGSGALVLVVL